MKEFKTIKLMHEDGWEIEDAIQIIQYLDGWAVLTKGGEIYTNATLK